MTLYLLPNLLASLKDHHLHLPASVDAAMLELDGLIAESEGEGRRYLKRFRLKKEPYQIPIALLDEEVDFLLEPLLKGERWGVVSDCGLPCLADPGAKLVKRARERNVPIVAFSGPSSITLALIQSGLSGQEFFFHGYIPTKEPEKALLDWEKMKGVTHIFIEAPYRNTHTFKRCLDTLQERTRFCVACDLTLPDQFISTQSILSWKKREVPDIQKKPTIFLFNS